MITEILEINSALKLGEKLDFIFIRNLSELYLGETQKYNKFINLEECIEVKFFDQTQEIRIFNDESNQLKAVLISLEENDQTIQKNFSLQNKTLGSEIAVTNILDFDEDGQVFIKTRILSSWKGVS